MAYLELEKGRLFFERDGKGNPPLVFAHGYACDHEDWKPQVDFFRARQCVVTCDLRGHGISDCYTGQCDIEILGADVVALMKSLDLPPAVLVGHSMGCRVILQSYIEAPEHVLGLILVDGGRLAEGDPQVIEQQTQENLHGSGYRAMIHQLFNDMFVEGSPPLLKERILRRSLTLPQAVGAPLFARLRGWDARYMESALSRVDVPLLVIQSTYINTERVRVALQPEQSTPWLELVRAHAPTAQIEIIGGVGHFPMLEAPDAVNRAIAEFLIRIPSD